MTRPEIAIGTDNATALSPTAAARAPQKRRDAMLDAATVEFLNVGYEGASLRQIVRLAGGSMDTLYRHFSTKELLFRAVVARRMSSGFEQALPTTKAGQLAKNLLTIGYAYAANFLSAESLAFYRMMISETVRIPETTRDLWEKGPHTAICIIQMELERAVASGEAEIEDCALVAAQFIDMVKGGLHLRALMAGMPPTDGEIRRSVVSAVAIFCRGVAIRQA